MNAPAGIKFFRGKGNAQVTVDKKKELNHDYTEIDSTAITHVLEGFEIAVSIITVLIYVLMKKRVCSNNTNYFENNLGGYEMTSTAINNSQATSLERLQ